MKKLLIVICVILYFGDVRAQQPKLYLKAFAGMHSHKFVYREEVKQIDYFIGWQAGFGFRVSYRKVFGEVDFNFIRSGVTVFLPDSTAQESGLESLDFKLNAFELPLKIGYVPVKTPFFKWYFYTGTALRFNTKGKVDIFGTEIKLKPKDVLMPVFNVDWILGTQFDLGWFNVDLLYSLGVTNSTRTDIRSNSHEIQLNFGILF